MATAYSVYGSRIAPVFDAAPEILVVTDQSTQTKEVIPSGENFEDTVTRLKELKVHTLICGAISREFQELLEFHRICVIAFVTGAVSSVMKHYREQKDITAMYAMPGCRCRGSRQRKRLRRRMNEYARFKRNRT